VLIENRIYCLIELLLYSAKEVTATKLPKFFLLEKEKIKTKSFQICFYRSRNGDEGVMRRVRIDL
jgi:hypothetical protein